MVCTISVLLSSWEALFSCAVSCQVDQYQSFICQRLCPSTDTSCQCTFYLDSCPWHQVSIVFQGCSFSMSEQKRVTRNVCIFSDSIVNNVQSLSKPNLYLSHSSLISPQCLFQTQSSFCIRSMERESFFYGNRAIQRITFS